MIAALSSWAVWVVVGQAFLWTPLLRGLVNGEKPAIHLDYRLAWSLWPGVVHVRDLVVTSQDRAVQWRLGIERGSVAVSIWQLPARLFHATSIRASGVRFALRRRIPKDQISPERLEGIPLIPGFDPIPVAEEGPEDEIPDWRYRLFSVWLEDIEAKDVRQVQVDRLRLDGPATVSGAFYLKPIRRLLIAPADLRFDGASFHYSPERVATQIRGRLGVRLAPLDPRGLTFPLLVRDLDLDADLSAELAGLEFLSSATGPRLRGANGPVRLALHMQAGQVLSGSRATADLRNASARLERVLLRTPRASVRFEIPPGPPPQAARASVRLADVHVGDAATVAEARVEVEGSPPDLADLRPPRTARLELRDGRIEDVAAAAAFARAPSSLRVERGTGAFAVDLAGPLDQMRGSARLSFADLALQTEGMHIGGDLRIDAAVRAFDPGRGADLGGTRIAIERGRLINPGGEEDTAPDWWAHLDLPRAALRTRQLLVDADVAGRCRDARPLVGLSVRREQLPEVLSGLFAMDDLAVRGSLLAGRDLVALRDLTATGEGASVRLAYRADPSAKRGAALLTVRGITVGLRLGEGGTQVHLGAATDWFQDAQAKLQPDFAARPLTRARRPKPRRAAAPLQSAE